MQAKFPNSSSYSLSQFEFDKTANYIGIIQAANAAGVTMYTIDASGLTVDSNVSAERRTSSQRIDTFLERNNLQSMLSSWPRRPGAGPFLNRNDLTVPLKEIEKDYSSYYSLGYRSLRSGLDRPHKVDVKLRNKKGLTAPRAPELRREGHRDEGARGRHVRPLLPPRRQPARRGPHGRQPGPGHPGKLHRPDHDPGAVFPARDAPGRQRRSAAGVVFYFVVIDTEEKQSELTTLPVPVEVDAKAFNSASARRDFVYDVKLVMIPGGQRLSLAVRDDVTNTTSYLQKSIFVSAFSGEAPAKP